MNKSYFKYWGKARKGADGYAWHPFSYHCLDVAAVALQWWVSSSTLRRSMMHETGASEEKTRGWVLFFVALHDLGKLDLRFQAKVRKLAEENYSTDLSSKEIQKEYYHGDEGYRWFLQENDAVFGSLKLSKQRSLQNWFAATAGHHGSIPTDGSDNSIATYDDNDLLNICEQDKQARIQWIEDLVELFLTPVGISIQDIPTKQPPVLLAGFCSICDWLGSNTDYFGYEGHTDKKTNQEYLDSKLDKAKEILSDFGLLSRVKTKGGMEHLYPSYIPRNIQTLVKQLAVEPSLVIMEANTGSGKTEAALAFATKLLAAGYAENITFALPSQATANAMLPRLEKVAPLIFENSNNIILAHGNSIFNEKFIELIEQAKKQINAQKNEEATSQCSEWLASSKKRAFLGQVAVTTVDQVMLSAITSLKHYFVRSFGVAKSILIIDEVHAYDAYMYGILEEVIKQQRKAGGSIILLSATLPSYQKQALCRAWGHTQEVSTKTYPLIVQATADNITPYQLENGQDLQSKEVKIELWKNKDIAIVDENLKRIVDVAEKGAKVALICNLVDDAQTYFQRLKNLTKIEVDLFHSRFRFTDRLKKEKSVINNYGEGSKSMGRILVGTQVIEQSLDIDFDWVITFICPIDLLFQRIGRLYRHEKEVRSLTEAVCTIVVPDSIDESNKKTVTNSFGKHQYIYQSIRTLYRTLLWLEREESISFPSAYREWIESVYQQGSWKNEAEVIEQLAEQYKVDCDASQMIARMVTKEKSNFNDDDGNAALLTREGELNLSLIPYYMKNSKKILLDNKLLLTKSDPYQREQLNMNTIGVPKSWGSFLPEQVDGLIYLEMENQSDQWIYRHKKCVLVYNFQHGLQRINNE